MDERDAYYVHFTEFFDFGNFVCAGGKGTLNSTPEKKTSGQGIVKNLPGPSKDNTLPGWAK